MSAERKKLLWISISACVFVLVVLAAGFFLLTPKKGGEQAPATIGNSAPPKAQDPHDFLSAPPPTPPLEQPQAQTKDGNVIIIYGDKPAAPVAPQGAPSASVAGETPAAAPEVLEPEAKAPAPAQKPAPAAAPAAKPKKPAAAKPAAKPATVKVDQYWIQVGAFQSRGRADELKQALAEKGVAALIIVKDISGKSYYRVRVGPYSSQAEANDWLSRLKDFPGCAEAKVWKTAVTKPKK
jgi:DedD protein